MMRLAAERMRPGGRIVNFSTSVIGLALPGYAAYAASKGGGGGADEHRGQGAARGKGITVNAIAPGPTATELF